MALLSPQAFSSIPRKRQGSQGHTLIDSYIFSYHRCLPYDDSGSVINEKTFSDPGSRMNIDPCNAVGIFGHDPGKEGDLLLK